MYEHDTGRRARLWRAKIASERKHTRRLEQRLEDLLDGEASPESIQLAEHKLYNQERKVAALVWQAGDLLGEEA